MLATILKEHKILLRRNAWAFLFVKGVNMFKNQPYLTKGVNERIPLLTQLFLWNLIENMSVEKEYPLNKPASSSAGEIMLK